MAKESRYELPRDRFDDAEPTGRVGAHRIVGNPNRAWVYVLAGAISILLLTGAGIAAVMFADVNLTKLFEQTDAEVAEAEKAVQPQLDPTATVVVLNGTPATDFALVVDEEITANGWGSVIFAGEAATTDIQKTTVFYSTEADEAAALGLAEQFGATTQLNSKYAQYDARLVLVIGANYQGPAQDKFDAALAGETAAVQPEDALVFESEEPAEAATQ